MASFRPYRPAVGMQAAIDEIANHPALYDAGVVAACLRLYADGRLGFPEESVGRWGPVPECSEDPARSDSL